MRMLAEGSAKAEKENMMKYIKVSCANCNKYLCLADEGNLVFCDEDCLDEWYASDDK